MMHVYNLIKLKNIKPAVYIHSSTQKNRRALGSTRQTIKQDKNDKSNWY
jgi:hypothetical protein